MRARSRLPDSVQEIADVIGRHNALYLIGRMPQCGKRSWRVVLYIPKKLGPDHPLVAIVGWKNATALARVFGGEILQPSGCAYLHCRARDQAIVRMHRDGVSFTRIAHEFGLSRRCVQMVVAKARRAEPRAAK